MSVLNFNINFKNITYNFNNEIIFFFLIKFILKFEFKFKTRFSS